MWQTPAIPAMVAARVTTRAMYAGLETSYAGTGIYKQNLSRERARKLAEVVHSDELELLAASDVYWDQVKSIEPDGVEDVFDLTVADRHNFVAGTIIRNKSNDKCAAG